MTITSMGTTGTRGHRRRLAAAAGRAAAVGRAVLCALLAAALAACDGERGGSSSAAGAGGAPAVALVEVPYPDLGGVSAELRGQIDQLRAEVDAGAGAGGAERLGQAWGDLARAYHAYGFLDAAAAAYDNARALQPEIAAWPYLEGLLERRRGQLEESAAAFRRAVEIDPGSAVARLRLGEALLDLGRDREAQPELEAAARSPAHAAAALAALGRAARDGGDHTRALQLYRQALAVEPTADLLEHSVAAAARALGDEKTAAEALARAGARPPEYPDPAAEGLDELRTTTGALLLRGTRALVSERPHEAVEQYRRAVAATPDDAEARRNLAMALRAVGDLDGARAELEQAVRLAPEDHQAYFDLGNLELARGAQQAAAVAFDRSLELAPDFVPARFNRANAELLLGQAEAALRDLERVLELEPGHRRARYQAAMARAALGRDGAARAELQALLDEDPEYGPALLGLAELERRDGDRAAAAELYRRVAESDADAGSRVDGHLGLAAIAAEDGRAEVVVDQVRAAVALAPGRDDLRDQLARALEASGQHLEAAEERRSLVELRPDSVMDRLLEATAWVQANRADLARERLEEARQRLPEERLIANSLARLLATAREPAVRDGARALEIAQDLYAVEPSPDVAETLAMALAEAGSYDQAAAVQRQLIERVRNAGQTGHLPRLEQNLRRYERREPVRM